jgi:hypothetical protein
MSYDNKPVGVEEKTPNGLPQNDQATLWEHIVLHKASGKNLMLFDLDIEHKRFQANKSQKKQKKRKMSALDAAATTFAIRERQRAYSAPAVPGSTPTDTDANTETNGGSSKPPQAFLATLEPISSQSTSFTTSFDSVTLDSSHNITFGAYQLLALSPETLRDDAERQATLVKGRPTEGLTMKRRMLAEEDLSVSDEQLTMSGALDRGDVRCEVCAARERAMGGLEVAGIVAL